MKKKKNKIRNRLKLMGNHNLMETKSNNVNASFAHVLKSIDIHIYVGNSICHCPNDLKTHANEIEKKKQINFKKWSNK